MTNSSLRGVRKHAEAISAKPACASEARLLRFARNDAENQSLSLNFGLRFSLNAAIPSL